MSADLPRHNRPELIHYAQIYKSASVTSRRNTFPTRAVTNKEFDVKGRPLMLSSRTAVADANCRNHAIYRFVLPVRDRHARSGASSI